MANKVSIIFEGDARDLFAKADAVEKRLNALGMKASTAPATMLSGAQTPALDRIISAQKNLTQTVETEAAKRSTAEIASAKAVTSAVVAEVTKQKAAIESVSSSSKLQDFRQEIQRRQGPQSVDVTKGFVGNLAGGLVGGQSPVETLSRQSELLADAFGRTAVSADAVAGSTAQASASVTLMGASVVSLAAIAAAGLVTIFAVKKATDDIREAAEKRLANEEKITGEWNKQHGIIGAIKKDLADAAKERAFDRFLGAGNEFSLGAARDRIFAQLEANQKTITDEMQRRQLLAGRFPQDQVTQLVGRTAQDLTAAGFNLLSPDKIKELTEQLQKLDAQIDKLNSNAPPSIDRQIQQVTVRSAIEAYQNSVKVQAEAAIEAEKKRVESIEKGISKVKDLGASWKSAFESVRDLAGAQNPISRALIDADRRMTQLRENTRGLPADVRAAFARAAQDANRRDFLGAVYDSRLSAADLRSQAQEFRQGFRNDMNDPAVVQRLVDQQMRALGVSGAGSVFTGPTGKAITSDFLDINDPRLSNQPFLNNGFPNFRFLPTAPGAATAVDPIQKAVQDQKLIELSRAIDPKNLRQDQRAAFSDALEREAKRRLDYEKKAQTERENQTKYQERMAAASEELLKLAQAGGLDAIVSVIDESDLSNVTRQSKPSDTAARRNRK